MKNKIKEEATHTEINKALKEFRKLPEAEKAKYDSPHPESKRDLLLMKQTRKETLSTAIEEIGKLKTIKESIKLVWTNDKDARIRNKERKEAYLEACNEASKDETKI
jgi:hypothetical protein